MPLNKEQMKLYQRRRRAQQRERGGIEGVKRANELIENGVSIFEPDPEKKVGVIAQEIPEPILPVPVLAEPRESCDGNQHGQTHTGEAREKHPTERRVECVTDSRGGQESIMNQIPPPTEVQHTKTDQLFENKKPGYYIFEKEIIQKPCWYCGETFETRLRLNKFCSPDHKERWLIQSFRMGKE